MKQLKHYYGKEEGETHGDLSFCLERIGMVPISLQAEIAERYSYIYLKLKTEGERDFRRRSNLWLLRTSEKYKCRNNGEGYF